MNCDKCGLPLDTDKVLDFSISIAICHKCGFVFSQKITGRYCHDSVYGNGQRAHVYAVVPYHCPSCNAEFKGHEFYCGLQVEEGVEALETVAFDTHRTKIHV